MKKILSIATNILFGIIGVCALFLLGAFLPMENGYDIRIVTSGSMEPAIQTGAIVATIPRKHYDAGDVVTFTSTRGEEPTTHRIVEVMDRGGTEMFVTKGDANEDPDHRTIQEEDILGKVFLSVPYMGYVFAFARTRGGYVTLVVLPILLLVGWETRTLVKRRKENTSKEAFDAKTL